MLEVPIRSASYHDPWAVSLNERLRMFRAEPVKVAYYYPQPDNSTFRYRCFNMATAINDHVTGVSASWFWECDGEKVSVVAKEADVLVVCRAMYSDTVAELIGQARRFGTRVVFDVDDCVFDTALVPVVVQTLDQHETRPAAAEAMWTHWFAYFARIRHTMQLCDEVVVTTGFLADKAREVLGKPTHVVPNFMSQEQIHFSQALVYARESAGSVGDGRLHFGYFSGTPTHNRDFALVAPALARLLRSDDSLGLRVVGFLDLSRFAFDGLEDRVEMEPLTNFMNLQRLIAETEVNLAPLQENQFTQCKSELKYFDAAAVAIPTLASPTSAMSRAIEHGVNGLLVRADGWDEHLRWIADEYRDRGIAMGRAAEKHALARYSPASVAGDIAAALGLGIATAA